MADFVIICTDVLDNPQIFILTPDEVYQNLHRGEKGGRESYWLQPKSYEQYKDKWEKIKKDS